jgi:hypothetical protein
MYGAVFKSAIVAATLCITASAQPVASAPGTVCATDNDCGVVNAYGQQVQARCATLVPNGERRCIAGCNTQTPDGQPGGSAHGRIADGDYCSTGQGAGLLVVGTNDANWYLTCIVDDAACEAFITS